MSGSMPGPESRTATLATIVALAPAVCIGVSSETDLLGEAAIEQATDAVPQVEPCGLL
jgi:hypothetical protein